MKITTQQINQLIDERYRERGRGICDAGMIKFEEIGTTKLGAKCVGTHIYLVKLELQNGRLTGYCSCPAFDNFGPCKHLAAVAYASILHQKEKYAPSPSCRERLAMHHEIIDRLNELSKPDLISMIISLTEHEEELLWLLENENDEY